MFGIAVTEKWKCIIFPLTLSPPGTYVGGVFYSIDIPELQPGERVQLPAWRYVQDQSRVVYIGCKELADCH